MADLVLRGDVGNVHLGKLFFFFDGTQAKIELVLNCEIVLFTPSERFFIFIPCLSL